MKRTGFLYDDRYQLHKTGPFHPEVPERLAAVYKGISDAGLLNRLVLISARSADMKWIEMVHDKGYIQRFESACRSNQAIFDSADNQMCPETYDVALMAVGGILEAVRMVMNGELDTGQCLLRRQTTGAPCRVQ
jgi:acetoin utilization deacetylase AcuC-like enzyme